MKIDANLEAANKMVDVMCGLTEILVKHLVRNGVQGIEGKGRVDLRYARLGFFNLLSEAVDKVDSYISDVSEEDVVHFLDSLPPNLACWHIDSIRNDFFLETTPAEFLASNFHKHHGAMLVPIDKPEWVYFMPETYESAGCLVRFDRYY